MPKWSPDGQKIISYQEDNTNLDKSYAYTVENLQQVFSIDGKAIDWSPNGRQLLVVDDAKDSIQPEWNLFGLFIEDIYSGTRNFIANAYEADWQPMVHTALLP
jgi:dipeptidyl aminopeptidase/acylaminoacyl peptidase